MKNLPPSIWLNLGDDVLKDTDFRELSDVTWSHEQVFNNDAQYFLESQWISVKDALPEEVTDVFYCNNRALCAEYAFGAARYYGKYWLDLRGYEINPTHWMPIPETQKF